MTDTTHAIGNQVGAPTKVTDFETHHSPVSDRQHTVEPHGSMTAFGWYHASELERIDEEAEPAPVSAGMAGPSPVDGSSAGTSAEPPTAESAVPTLETLAAQVSSLNQQVRNLASTAQWQRTTNEKVLECLAILGIQPNWWGDEKPLRIAVRDDHCIIQNDVNGAFRHRNGAPHTSRRVHTTVTKSTGGYQHGISVEVTSDDPTWSVTDDVRETLDLADKDARRHIIDAEYRDLNGLPGDDEI